MYAGLTPILLQVAPNSALTFMFYDNLYIEKLLTIQNEPVLYLILGGLAGFLAKVVTYPLDTIKKRMQLNGSLPSVPKYKNMRDCFVRIVADEGVMALYNGLSAQLYKTTLSSASTFCTFEMVNSNLQIRSNT